MQHKSPSGPQSRARVVLAFLVLTSMLSSLVLTGSAGTRRATRIQNNNPPRSGAPEGVLPNLDQIRNRRPSKPMAPAAVPSTMRSQRNPLAPRTVRRVGDRLPNLPLGPPTKSPAGAGAYRKDGQSPQPAPRNSSHAHHAPRVPVAPLPSAAATVPVFTDDPLVENSSVIRAVHVTELRDVVDQVRYQAGLGMATWTDVPLQGVIIKAVHITELRSRLDEARLALGLSAASYTDPDLGTGYFVKAVHIRDLRQAVAATMNSSGSLLYLRNFHQSSLSRQPTPDESSYWLDIMNAAYANGQNSISLAMRELGKTIFESAEYAARNRSDHWYVYDLYKTYLSREPDAPGWAYWESVVPSNGRENIRRAFDESGEFAAIVATLVTTGSPSTAVSSLASARIDPFNQPGNGLTSQDAEWSVSLLSLPGRSGLDLGLSLSYSSMIWTHSGPYIYFDEDNGSPSPGFRLGFPTVQERFFDAQAGRNVYLMIAGGNRVSLRQVGSSNVYEATDSSYLQLVDNGGSLLVRSTDGTQLSYQVFNNEWHCTQVKDRNGNYLTINYDWLGHITTVVDTLARTITFNYDANANLTSITQSWTVDGTPTTHTWVSFGWETETISSTFSSVSIVGARNGFQFPGLKQVGFADGTYCKFLYNSAGQVSRITNYASDSNPASDNHPRNYTAFDYTSPSNDCPRLSASRVWAENWNGINNVPSEVVTHYAEEGSAHTVYVTGDPNSVVYKEFYGTSWQRGLTTQSEVWAGGVKQKWTTSTWTQDNTGVNYQTNPRVTESHIYDGTNHKRSTVSYTSFTLPSGASCALPSDVSEYAADATAILRRSHSDYRMDATADAAYLDKHIIGLVKEQSLYEVSGQSETLMSKVGYEYDELGSIQGTAAPVSHDNDNYSATFRSGRANLSSVKRYDVTNTSLSTVSHVQYNTTGAVVTTIDPEAHQTSVSYADSFSDGNNSRNTLAYPTTGTDADNFSTTIQYNFDFGARTRMQGPPPQNQPQGMIQTFSYDAAARIKQVTTVNNSAYTRYVYGPDYVQSFATVNTVADEAYSSTVVDGLGRTVLTAQNHPGSVGGYSSKNTLYDVLGQTTKQSNPTETNGSFNPAGDDAAGWLYTQQTYDWKGRPLVTTNTDSTTKEASYAGCGCAGGEVVTLTDEGTIDAGVAKRRQQKIYSDILGRQVKTEVLNWQGGSVYATTVNTYNARDQIKLVRQYQGDESSAVYQDTVMTYDGYARLKTKHVPEQDANTATTYNYNSDDTPLSVVDARGSSATFTHNARRLVTHVSYDPSAGIADTPDVSIGYDAAGNRISMSDGLGSMSYGYDQLSRLTSETRTFTSVGTFPLNYSYNLANQLTSVNDQAFSTTMGYAYDLAGRLNQLTGSGYPNVSQFASNIQYRAWGAVKAVSYGNGTSLSTGYNSRLLPASFSVPGAISKTYQYYSDGRLDYSQDVDEPRYDRKSGYDQVGRLTKALSGAEARGLPATEDRPYNESYQQDVWGNLTNRTSQQWARSSVSEPAVYTNNRRSDWHYDAGGNWLDDGTYNALQRKYDAAGRLVKIEHPAYSNNPKRTDDYDGDGDRLRTGYHQSGCSPEYNCPFDYTYYLRSTALGGQIISEVRGNGQKAMGYIYYPNGTVIAVQKLATPTDAATYLLWRHTDPSNSSVRASDSNGWTFGEYPNRYNAENDPLGADNGLEDPGELSLATAPDDFAPQWLVPSRPAGKCRLDGMPIDCSDAMEMLDHGTANVLITLTNGRRIEAAAQSLGVGVFRFYIDGKDLKGDSGGYTGKTVVDDKDGHAYEVMDQTTNSTNGRWETFSFNSRPRPNNSGFDQNKAGGGRLGRQPCATMADYAQNIADSVKGSANPLLEFDTKFAAEYLGRFPDNITGRPMRTFADVLHYSKGGGTINRGASGDQEGQADFLPGFYEQSSRGDAEDQTHHFAAYFSLGINNRRVSQTMAKRLDSSGGKKDKDLGSAAFSIGRTLQRDPSLLANIGDTILRNICRP